MTPTDSDLDSTDPPAPTRHPVPPPFLDARDALASAAMQGELAACTGDSPDRDYQTADDLAGLAAWAYRVADAMILAREGG